MKWNVTSFDGMEGFMGATNNYTGGWFWSLMLLGIGIAIFSVTSQKTTADRAFLTAGMGTWLFGTFIFFLGWINWMVYLASILALVGGVVSAIISGDQEV
jgi:hypothetical protein